MGAIRSCIVMVTGWSLEYIDDLDLPDVWELYDYFDQWPPMHMLMRAELGYKPPPKRRDINLPKPLEQKPAYVQNIYQLPAHVQRSILETDGCKTIEEYHQKHIRQMN